MTADNTIETLQSAANASQEIAEAIHRIDKAMTELMAAGLTRRALVALIKEHAGHLRKQDIHDVLAALQSLHRNLE